MIKPAISITHAHLLSIINSESQRRGSPSPGQSLRLLDAGCGNGHLIAYLTESLPVLHPATTFEIYGLDVHDHGVQQAEFLSQTIQLLTKQRPCVPWSERITLIGASESWPYPEEFFDIIISNQVLEHVENHNRFFGEIYRTLSWGGYSVHLFPLKHYMYEGHLKLPFVHKIMNYDFMLAYIKLLSSLGLGKFKIHRQNFKTSLDEYSERHADYMHHFTNYLSYKDVLTLGKRHYLRTSFRYTKEFYTSKFRSLLGKVHPYTYVTDRPILIDWITLFFLKYISSITLFLEKEETYRRT